MDDLFLDFSKALIKSRRASTPQTRVSYWIRGQTLHWIKYFLLNRSQNVIMQGCKSPSADVMLGIPQCTDLDPQLFLVFMNDLLEAVQSSDARLFADYCLLRLYKHIATPGTKIFQIRANNKSTSLPEKKKHLDLIMTSLPAQFVDIHSPDRLSHHDIVSGTLKVVIPPINKPQRRVFRYQKGDYESMRTDTLKFAKETYFNGYSDTRSVQENFNLITSFI